MGLLLALWILGLLSGLGTRGQGPDWLPVEKGKSKGDLLVPYWALVLTVFVNLPGPTFFQKMRFGHGSILL